MHYDMVNNLITVTEAGLTDKTYQYVLVAS